MNKTNQRTRQVGNGEGSLFKSESLKCWMFQYYVGGKRRTIKQKKNEGITAFKTRVTKLKNELNTGTYIETNKQTFINISKNYIENKYRNNLVSARTYIRDKETIQQLEKVCKDIINMPIQKITVNHIRNVLPNITIYSNNSICKIYRLMKKTFSIAVEDRIIPFNPMLNSSIKQPKSIKADKKVESLTIEEQRKLESIFNNEEKDHKYRNILLLQLYTGMRIGEVLALKKSDINLIENTITIKRTITKDENNKVILGETPKTENSKRTIPMNEETQILMKEIFKKSISNINGMLFYNNDKNRLITNEEIRPYLMRINKKYNIAPKLHSHMLRHTYATRMIEAEVSEKLVQELLGHKDIETTLNTYTSVTQRFSQSQLLKYEEYRRVNLK